MGELPTGLVVELELRGPCFVGLSKWPTSSRIDNAERELLVVHVVARRDRMRVTVSHLLLS